MNEFRDEFTSEEEPSGEISPDEATSQRRILVQPQNPHEARTQGLIQTAYDYGNEYTRPPLSDEAKTVGGYTWDRKPADLIINA